MQERRKAVKKRHTCIFFCPIKLYNMAARLLLPSAFRRFRSQTPTPAKVCSVVRVVRVQHGASTSSPSEGKSHTLSSVSTSTKNTSPSSVSYRSNFRLFGVSGFITLPSQCPPEDCRDARLCHRPRPRCSAGFLSAASPSPRRDPACGQIDL